MPRSPLTVAAICAALLVLTMTVNATALAEDLPAAPPAPLAFTDDFIPPQP